MDAKVTPRRRQPRKSPERLPDTPDPVEIAMVAAASGKPMPDVARRVLEEQAQLIHAQRIELGLKHVGNIVRAALWALLAVVALLFVIILGTAIYRAARVDALVVESFRVPASMAAQGLTGEVVATQILDKVAEFQAKTESVRAASSYDNNWGDDLKIDIPNTGATAEQVWKLLRSWLGEETRISGEVVQTSDTTVLTTRVGTSAGERFTSRTGNLDDLVTHAAEHILRETQPYRFSVYSARVSGDRADRVAVLQDLTRHPSAAERKWAFNGLAMVASDDGDPRARLYWAKRALAIDPQMFPAQLNVAFAAADLGQDQMAADTLAAAARFKTTDEYDAQSIASNKCLNQGVFGMITRNPAHLTSAATCIEQAPGTASVWAPYYRASAGLLRHDTSSVLRFRQPVSEIAPSDWAANITADMQLRAEIERGASPELARALQRWRTANDALWSQNSSAPRSPTIATADWPLETEALLLLGRVDEAAQRIAGTPRDCYLCLRMRGKVAEAQGRLADAQQWYIEAVRQAPRLAPAYVDWARLLIMGGRPEAAIVRLTRASELAPNWADPLKVHGDALIASGRVAEAFAKYREALALAPKWGELRLAMAKARSAR